MSSVGLGLGWVNVMKRHFQELARLARNLGRSETRGVARFDTRSRFSSSVTEECGKSVARRGLFLSSGATNCSPRNEVSKPFALSMSRTQVACCAPRTLLFIRCPLRILPSEALERFRGVCTHGHGVNRSCPSSDIARTCEDCVLRPVPPIRS
jgi:hypothetical protein